LPTSWRRLSAFTQPALDVRLDHAPSARWLATWQASESVYQYWYRTLATAPDASSAESGIA